MPKANRTVYMMNQAQTSLRLFYLRAPHGHAGKTGITLLRCGLTLLACAACGAQAQTTAANYPVKFVRFIVPYAPGGSSDVLARTLGQKLGSSLGQTFVIDNRPGAGSMVGTDIAAKAT